MGAMRVGWIGVGRMGEPMARRLLAAGVAVTVFDRDPARMAVMAEAGATAAPGPAEATRDAEVVFSMVPDDAALEEVAGALAPVLRAGQVFVEMSTVSPAASARVARLLAPGGASYLRCPVSGSTATAAAGQLAFFVSGPEAALQRCAGLLDMLGAKRLHVGAAEEARVCKLLVNIVVAAMPALLGEAVAFGEALGLPRDTAVEALAQSVAASPLLGYKAAALKARDWTPAASVDLLSKDLDIAIAAAAEAGLAQPITDLVRAAYAAAQAAGDGGLDFFRISEASRPA
jgi:3-hydroxyisobutyrate dehydrogenase